MAIRLVYASKLKPGVSSKDLDLIATTSARRNAEVGITGILALENNSVCQILEGPEDAVLTLFGKIRSDNRHEGVVELERCEIVETRFRNWGMMRRAMIDVVMMAYSR